MTTKEQIILDFHYAKAHNETKKKTILMTLIGELDRKKTKDLTDAEVVKTVKWMLENCTPEEAMYLKPYLPEEITIEELESIICTHVTDNAYSGMKDMGKVMKYLSDNYAGKYDGTAASSIVKSILI
jgi:Glu-tRNA(Gln) amidotransferase subunit E-like FAD-binding protein